MTSVILNGINSELQARLAASPTIIVDGTVLGGTELGNLFANVLGTPSLSVEQASVEVTAEAVILRGMASVMESMQTGGGTHIVGDVISKINDKIGLTASPGFACSPPRILYEIAKDQLTKLVSRRQTGLGYQLSML
jgi:hypothetical protein